MSVQDHDDADDLGEIPPANAYKRPKFTRAESEIFGTYSHTSMSRAAGDDLFQWACNEAYSYKDVRYGSMRSLTDAIRKNTFRMA